MDLTPTELRLTRTAHWYIVGSYEVSREDSMLVHTSIKSAVLEMLFARAYIQDVLGLDLPEELEATVEKAVDFIRGLTPGRIAELQEKLVKRLREIKNQVKRLSLGNDVHETLYQEARRTKAPVSLIKESGEDEDLGF